MSQYDKLGEHLGAQPLSRLRLSFKQVEKILGFDLPNSAYRYPAWWANNPEPGRHANVWISAGWQTKDLDLGGRQVTFLRTRGGSGHSAASTGRSADLRPNSSPVVEPAALSVSLFARWNEIGAIVLDTNNELAFPEVVQAPGIYRFRLTGNGTTQHYVGETVQLRRRFRHYRNPGPSQTTNIRIRELIINHLNAGYDVFLDLIHEDVTLYVGNSKQISDLSEKATRRLIENAVMVAEGEIDVESLNR